MKRLLHICIAGAVTSIILLSSCAKDLDQTIVVHDELVAYFDMFEVEGKLRGIDIDLKQAEIHGFMRIINEGGVIGQCRSSDTEGKSIVIDKNGWTTLSELEKEFIVFHELGHCYLDRVHDDSRNRDGTCTSLMHSSTSACRNIYSSQTRKHYLDELFFN